MALGLLKNALFNKVPFILMPPHYTQIENSMAPKPHVPRCIPKIL